MYDGDWDDVVVTKNPRLKEIDVAFQNLGNIGGSESENISVGGGVTDDGGGGGEAGDDSGGGGGGGGGGVTVICPDNPECGAHDCQNYDDLYTAESATINYIGSDVDSNDVYATVVGSDGRNYQRNIFGGASQVTGGASAFNGATTKVYPGVFCKNPGWVGNAESASPNTTFSFESVDKFTEIHGFNTAPGKDFEGVAGDFPAISNPADFDGTYPATGTRVLKGNLGIYLDFNNPTGDPANRGVSLDLRGAAPSYRPENSIARCVYQSWRISINPLTGVVSLAPVETPNDYAGPAFVSKNTGLSTTLENERRLTGWYHFVWNGSYQVLSQYAVGLTQINMTAVTPIGTLSISGSTTTTQGSSGSTGRLLAVHSSDGVPSIKAATSTPFGDRNVHVIGRHIGTPNEETRSFARLHENYQAPEYCTEIPQA